MESKLDYQSTISVPGRQSSQVWVFIALLVVWFSGALLGGQAWFILDQPGKDPALELAYGRGIGLAFGLAVYAILHRRARHVSLTTVLVAFVLGLIPSLLVIGWVFLRRA